MIKRLWNNQYVPKAISLDYRHVPMKLKTLQLTNTWVAHWSPNEAFHYGYGNTEEEAIEDLRRLDEERAEAEEEN